jgi:hypothetical protein
VVPGDAAGDASRRLHFDLSHVTTELAGLRVAVGTDRYPVNCHTEKTVKQAVTDNAALALLPDSERHRITHYADIDDASIVDHRPTRVQVLYDHGDPEFHLPGLVLLAIHLPRGQRRKHRVSKLANAESAVHVKLMHYGVDEVSGATAAEVFEAADDFNTPLDCAKAVIFHHPELASRDPYTATVVLDDHVESLDNKTALFNLATTIAEQGQSSPTGGWARITQCTEYDGTPMTYEYDFLSHKAGDPVEHYELSETTAGALPGPVRTPLSTANNDMRLQSRSWSVSQGTSAIHQTPAGVAKHAQLAALGGEKFKWTLVNVTGNHGLHVDADSISFDDGSFQIDAKNIFMRSLSAYAELLDENGDPIANPKGWDEYFPSWFPLTNELESDTTKFVSTLSAVNTIMGIPMPTDPTTLKFVWPEDATAVRLRFGGAGTSKWDGTVDPVGLILTGIFQYGIPLFFMVAGAAVTSTKFFKDFVDKTENVIAAIAVAFGPVGGGVAVAAALTNVKRVLFSFASALAGIIVKKGMEKLAAYITAQLTEAEMEDSIPYVGWACRVANTLLDWAQIAISTGEILSSPATIEFDVRRAFDLDVTIHPDPAHGEPNRPDTAVWPAVSDHYQVTVQYKGGTSFVQTGSMPATTSSTPLALTFASVPAGGQVQIITAIYSKSGWLCGKWTSDWFDALPDPDAPTPSKSVAGSITEILVPLTVDTQYAYKERIAYDADAGKHVWQAGDPPTATIAALDCSNVGVSLCKPVGITIFERTFEIAYVWQGTPQSVPLCGQQQPGAGQAYVFQNLSVLADPDSRLVYPSCAVGAQPYVAYDQYGAMPGTGGPPPPYNFFLDPRADQYHLRLVPLDADQPVFNLSGDLKSWGQFQLAHLDGIVVHPSGYVIGVSWADHKMAILQVPAAPTDDADAEIATLVSGEGVRQGLLQGPIAITVTPDGRLLVLETLNRRVQAFDLNGNPVASFDGPQLFELPAAQYAPDLDAGRFSDALQAQFRDHRITYLCDLPSAFSSELDATTISDALRSTLAGEGLNLSWDPSDPAASSSVSVTIPGQQWEITDAGKPAAYTVVAQSDRLVVYEDLTGVVVTVRAQGSQWILAHAASARSWDVRAGADSMTLALSDYLSYLPLRQPDAGVNVTYLDLATEAKGYVYVLSYQGDGKQATDYFLDIYGPDGAFVCRTPDARLTSTPQHVAAARLAIDVWRNAYTLNYEAIVGAGGRVEPSIGHWMPSPPLFSLAVSEQAAFDDHDVTMVAQLFSQHGYTLPPDTTITTISSAGHWTITGASTTFDAIRAGTEIEVYSLAQVGAV